MRFAIMLSGPAGQASHQHALKFCQAAISAGHQLLCVFFIGDAVKSGAAVSPAAAEQLRWQQLASTADVELTLCSGSASHCAIGTEQLADHFALGGLGLWQDAISQADRCLRFGN